MQRLEVIPEDLYLGLGIGTSRRIRVGEIQILCGVVVILRAAAHDVGVYGTV